MLNIPELMSELDSYYASGDRDAMESFFQKYIPAAEAAADYGALLALYNEWQGLLRTGGRAREGAEVTVKALGLIDKLHLNGTRQHAITLINAGTAHSIAGQATESVAYFKEAEELLLRLGEGGYTLAALYNNMSHVLNRMGRYEESHAALKKALPIIRTLRGEEDAVATTELGIASALMSLGDLPGAEQYLQSALEYYKSDLGARDPHRCAAYSTAAELHCRKGEYAEAAALYEKSLSLIKQIYGENDAYQITARNLARVKEKAGIGS